MTSCFVFVHLLILTATATAQTVSFPFFDARSRPGDLVSKESTAKQWLKTATYRWMTNLPDTLPVNQVSIPGTHDSSASNGGLFCETQPWSLAEQLRAGIRYFDIRTRRAGKVFAIHHGVCFLNLFFEQVMNEFKRFLEQNPSEFLLMRIMEEHTPLPGSQSFSEIWASYRNSFGNLFLSAVPDSGPLPNVGALRGKVLVLRQASFGGVGMKYDGRLTIIQDAYQVFLTARKNPFGRDTVSVNQKKELIRQLVRRAASSDKLVLNHASGGTGVLPEAAAWATHPVVSRELGPYKSPRRIGVIIMDYPGDRLVYQIVKSNMISSVWCNSITWRGRSDRTFAEFRLPRSVVGSIITFRKGSYGSFVFPRCHRVTWTDLRFSCDSPRGKWTLVGKIDADGFCHSRNTDQNYLVVGNY